MAPSGQSNPVNLPVNPGWPLAAALAQSGRRIGAQRSLWASAILQAPESTVRELSSQRSNGCVVWCCWVVGLAGRGLALEKDSEARAAGTDARLLRHSVLRYIRALVPHWMLQGTRHRTVPY